MCHYRRGGQLSITRKGSPSSDGTMRETAVFRATARGADLRTMHRLELEQVGRVLVFQFLAQLDQFLLKRQDSVIDRVRQVAVVHGGVG